ncbi:hypothetical protein [Desulfocurvus sp. DL9XJH121]
MSRPTSPERAQLEALVTMGAQDLSLLAHFLAEAALQDAGAVARNPKEGPRMTNPGPDRGGLRTYDVEYTHQGAARTAPVLARSRRDARRRFQSAAGDQAEVTAVTRRGEGGTCRNC